MITNAIDLNLLVVFDALMQEKTVTRTGHRLGMSQPAVSHALARLRHTLHDELFVRSSDGMRPTPRAERMVGPVRAALQELQLSLEADEFDALHASHSFVIAVNNYAARAIVPALAHKLALLAPAAMLEVRPVGMVNVLDQLDSGEVELALSPVTEGGDRFKCAALLEDDYVAVLAPDHPSAAEAELSIEAFAAMPHITVTSSGDDTRFVDQALAARNLVRQVSARLPLLSLVSVVLDSRSVAVIPRRVAAGIVATSPLVMRKLPFPSPRVTLSMIWHRRLDNHPAHRWLRATLRAAIQET